MIALVRVDNRLIHGQVVSTWIPHLRVDRVVVADAEAAGSALMKAAMTMAVPPSLEVDIERPDDVDWAALSKTTERVLVLVRDVADAERALAAGLAAPALNLGNVHFGEGRKPVTASLFLSEPELASLARIAEGGVIVEARALPTESPLSLAQVRAKLEGGG